jgi:hypothetical protein
MVAVAGVKVKAIALLSVLISILISFLFEWAVHRQK